jgi:KTSC domain
VELHDVTSSVLAAVGYDPERRVLEARFRTGRVYHYFDVPHSIFKLLLAARSKGQYFNKAIRSHLRSELVYDAHRPGRR